jgi:hypothetical protein
LCAAVAVLDPMVAARTDLPSCSGGAELLGAEHPMKRFLHHRWRQLADVLDALSPPSREGVLSAALRNRQKMRGPTAASFHAAVWFRGSVAYEWRSVGGDQPKPWVSDLRAESVAA